MRRRKFITGLGAALSVVSPVVAWAQQREQVRRIAFLNAGVENAQGNQIAIATIRDGLAKLGWVEGRNLRIELRYGAAMPIASAPWRRSW